MSGLSLGPPKSCRTMRTPSLDWITSCVRPVMATEDYLPPSGGFEEARGSRRPISGDPVCIASERRVRVHHRRATDRRNRWSRRLPMELPHSSVLLGAPQADELPTRGAANMTAKGFHRPTPRGPLRHGTRRSKQGRWTQGFPSRTTSGAGERKICILIRRERTDRSAPLGSRDGARGRHGVLLAAIGERRRAGRSAHVVVRWTACASRSGQSRGTTECGVQRSCGRHR